VPKESPLTELKADIETPKRVLTPELIIAIVGTIVSILTFIFGRGWLPTLIRAPDVRCINLSPPSISSTMMHGWVIENIRGGTANDIQITIKANDDTPIREMEVISSENNHKIERGGVGTNNVVITAARLVSTHSIAVTMLTEKPTSFVCEAASAEGPSNQYYRGFALTVWDIGVLVSVGVILASVIARIVRLSIRALEKSLVSLIREQSSSQEGTGS
jgi:hypothetical protein